MGAALLFLCAVLYLGVQFVNAQGATMTATPTPSRGSQAANPAPPPTGDEDDGILGLNHWEWAAIVVGAILLALLCCVSSVFLWMKYKAWKFNSDWEDDHR